MADSDFDDLLAANAAFASDFQLRDLPGVAAAGLAVVTCMDSRIDPLAVLGLKTGDAKIVRNPGGRVTPQAMEALVLAVHLLGADRIVIMPHTRCAVASNTEEQLRTRLNESAQQDATWLPLSVTTGQLESLAADVHAVKSHPLIPDSVKVGGFVYDVDSGLLKQEA
jgi:carbonic anhydrase